MNNYKNKQTNPRQNSWMKEWTELTEGPKAPKILTWKPSDLCPGGVSALPEADFFLKQWSPQVWHSIQIQEATRGSAWGWTSRWGLDTALVQVQVKGLNQSKKIL